MDEKIKMIAILLGGTFVLFLITMGAFWIILSPGQQSAAQTPESSAAPQVDASMQLLDQRSLARARGERVPGGEVLAFADVLGESIPLEVKIRGYGSATWGMSVEQVLARLAEDGMQSPEMFRPEDSDFTSVVALNPDSKRYKIEYRFYDNRLFHIEVFYSDYFKTNTFNAFLLTKMSEYGRPYEQYATVDEMGSVIFHAKWDTEESLIELVSRPNGFYSLFVSSQLTLIQLEEARKTEERLTY